jgi:hypothetical protein
MGQLWKNVSIADNSGRQLNLPLLAATATIQYFTMTKSLGMENQDSARLIEVLYRMVGPAQEIHRAMWRGTILISKNATLRQTDVNRVIQGAIIQPVAVAKNSWARRFRVQV